MWRKGVYLFAWCTVMLFAAFPRFVLEGDMDFLNNIANNKEYIIGFVIPMVMIVVGYLFDVAYSLTSVRPGYNMLKFGFISSILVFAFSLLGIVFTMYFTNSCAKIFCFVLTFLLVSVLKGISLIIAEDEVVNVIKVS
ncbi:hypothetical protein [Bacteroides faecium]|uniref:Transmembrane protein n=1 Tax=Bacteroides faecium TaxID=2715212 RepID=A0A6H0KU38_9BACE|nr:hypothetical protein [Bacteroides faecium]QIU96709.1 hypothetical protein BacF7301_22290 [Bacteroides faecium]